MAEPRVMHIVHFGYKPSTSAADKAEIASRFLALAKGCRLQAAAAGQAQAQARTEANEQGDRYIVGITGGTDNSPEGAAHGLEHSFIVTFRNLADRDYYVHDDPVHAEFKAFVGPHIASVTVLDFSEGQF